jgi:hypothetical protein
MVSKVDRPVDFSKKNPSTVDFSKKILQQSIYDQKSTLDVYKQKTPPRNIEEVRKPKHTYEPNVSSKESECIVLSIRVRRFFFNLKLGRTGYEKGCAAKRRERTREENISIRN